MPEALAAFASALDSIVKSFESNMKGAMKAAGQGRGDEANSSFEIAARLVIGLAKSLEQPLGRVDQPLRAKIVGYIRDWAEQATQVLPGGRDFDSRGILLIWKGARGAEDNYMRAIVRSIRAGLSRRTES